MHFTSELKSLILHVRASTWRSFNKKTYPFWMASRYMVEGMRIKTEAEFQKERKACSNNSRHSEKNRDRC